MPLSSSAIAPFGPLQTLNDHIIRTAHPLTVWNAHRILLYPIAPLFLQALLLQYPDTRKYRAPISVITLYFIIQAWKNYRFEEPWLNAGNNLLGVMMLHLIGKAVEFALLVDPVIDPYAAKGRNRLMCAYDLLCNSRWIGLRPVHVDTPSSVSESSKAKTSTSPSSKTQQHPDDRWMARPTKIRNRTQACLRHFKLALVYYTILDTLLHLLRFFGQGTVGQPKVPIGGVEKFFSDPYILLPRSQYSFRAPRLLVDLIVKSFIGGGVFTMLVFGSHMAALVNVGLGLYEVEAWEVDLFQSPMASESVLDFWGQGWHQIFRHHFNLLTTLIMNYLNLPQAFLLPIVFSLSGALHALGEISMSPAPKPSALFIFFLVQAFACMAEVQFKRITGKKVQGWPGWIWKNIWLAISSSHAVHAELASGLGGTIFMPDLGPGRWICTLVTKHIVDRP